MQNETTISANYIKPELDNNKITENKDDHLPENHESGHENFSLSSASLKLSPIKRKNDKHMRFKSQIEPIRVRIENDDCELPPRKEHIESIQEIELKKRKNKEALKQSILTLNEC